MTILQCIILSAIFTLIVGKELKEREYEFKKGQVDDLAACQCKLGYGCVCTGNDGSLRVTVVFFESHLKDGKDTVIWANFEVGDEHFLKRFTVRTLTSFCRTVHGSQFCFEIHRYIRDGFVLGYIDLAKPKKISLGFFKLPVL